MAAPPSQFVSAHRAAPLSPIHEPLLERSLCGSDPNLSQLSAGTVAEDSYEERVGAGLDKETHPGEGPGQTSLLPPVQVEVHNQPSEEDPNASSMSEDFSNPAVGDVPCQPQPEEPQMKLTNLSSLFAECVSLLFATARHLTRDVFECLPETEPTLEGSAFVSPSNHGLIRLLVDRLKVHAAEFDASAEAEQDMDATTQLPILESKYGGLKTSVVSFAKLRQSRLDNQRLVEHVDSASKGLETVGKLVVYKEKLGSGQLSQVLEYFICAISASLCLVHVAPLPKDVQVEILTPLNQLLKGSPYEPGSDDSPMEQTFALIRDLTRDIQHANSRPRCKETPENKESWESGSLGDVVRLLAEFFEMELDALLGLEVRPPQESGMMPSSATSDELELGFRYVAAACYHQLADGLPNIALVWNLALLSLVSDRKSLAESITLLSSCLESTQLSSDVKKHTSRVVDRAKALEKLCSVAMNAILANPDSERGIQSIGQLYLKLGEKLGLDGQRVRAQIEDWTDAASRRGWGATVIARTIDQITGMVMCGTGDVQTVIDGIYELMLELREAGMFVKQAHLSTESLTSSLLSIAPPPAGWIQVIQLALEQRAQLLMCAKDLSPDCGSFYELHPLLAGHGISFIADVPLTATIMIAACTDAGIINDSSLSECASFDRLALGATASRALSSLQTLPKPAVNIAFQDLIEMNWENIPIFGLKSGGRQLDSTMLIPNRLMLLWNSFQELTRVIASAEAKCARQCNDGHPGDCALAFSMDDISSAMDIVADYRKQLHTLMLEEAGSCHASGGYAAELVFLTAELFNLYASIVTSRSLNHADSLEAPCEEPPSWRISDTFRTIWNAIRRCDSCLAFCSSSLYANTESALLFLAEQLEETWINPEPVTGAHDIYRSAQQHLLLHLENLITAVLKTDFVDETNGGSAQMCTQKCILTALRLE